LEESLFEDLDLEDVLEDVLDEVLDEVLGADMVAVVGGEGWLGFVSGFVDGVTAGWGA
jgi:phosphatidylglycerophosphatase A